MTFGIYGHLKLFIAKMYSIMVASLQPHPDDTTASNTRVVGLESWTWTQVGLESDFLRTWTGLGLEGQGLGLGLGLEG